MSKKNETAGKTARRGARCAAHSKATPKKWRTVRRDGRTVYESPDGRTIYGTAQEVRDAALMPWRRHWLAEALKVRRMTCRNRDELHGTAAAARRDAVCMGAKDAAADRASVAIPAELLIWAMAAARAHGQTVEEWTCAWLREAVDVELDEQADGTLPLTWHEIAALGRIAEERRQTHGNGHRSACA